MQHRQNTKVMEVYGGTQVNTVKQLGHSAKCCFNWCAGQSHNVRKATVGEQLSRKTIHPAMRAQLHLPLLDLSWALSRWGGKESLLSCLESYALRVFAAARCSIFLPFSLPGSSYDSFILDAVLFSRVLEIALRAFPATRRSVFLNFSLLGSSHDGFIVEPVLSSRVLEITLRDFPATSIALPAYPAARRLPSLISTFSV